MDFSAGLRVVDVSAGEINTIHVTGLCFEGGEGSGRVKSVEAAPDSGLEVRRFTVLDKMADVGGARQSFAELGLTADQRDVSHKCGASEEPAALYVEVALADGRSAYSPYLTIATEANGVSDSFRYPLGLTLCVVGEADEEFCSGEARAGRS
ncbi:hypothetical protein UG56_001940 [Nocardioides luteus]|uniref:Uncharacterized protein n=1 Tax=Nocardioides luteus TaxID=1844 RepID=A0A1J4NAI3_9ACTN|nr:hypothetical protein UG56_001940 [Nocardioides luteus]